MKNALLCILLVLLCGGRLPAQKGDDSTSLQSQANQKFSRLVTTLARLSLELKTRDADKSSLLKAALKYCGEKGIEKRMTTISSLLGQKKWHHALEQMKIIEADLGTLLDLLLDRNQELLDLLKEIERLESLHQEAERLIKEQEKERDQAQEAADLKQLLADTKRAAGELARLEKEQRQLAGEAAAGKGSARKQEGLAKQTKKVKAELDRLEQEKKRLTGKDNPKASAAAEAAAQAMEKAAGEMSKGKPAAAVPSMQKAADKLAAAQKALEESRQEVENKIHRLDLEEQKKAQEKTAAATKRLADELKKEKQEGQESPGGEKMGEAVPNQKKAGEKLGENKPGEAVPEQNEALDKMKDAKEKLAQALEQARRKLQEELLRALEERIANMLARQKRISAQTRILDQQAAGIDPPPRAVRLKAKKLGEQEMDLAGEANLALRLLKDEGTTVVIPEIVATVREDLLLLAADLAEAKTDAATQMTQEEVESLLAAILESIKKEQEDRDNQNNDDKNQDDQDQDQPLVPRSAELKMIRILQNAVYRSTLRAKIIAEKDPAAGKRLAERLAPKEKKITSLTRKLATQIDKDLAESEGEK